MLRSRAATGVYAVQNGKGMILLAEKYGVVPPKFTKAWWSYFWDYYKWYVIGGGFALLCVIITAVQCSTREKYDLTVTYAGQLVFDSETSAAFENAVSPFAADVDGNGEQSVFFQTLSISGAEGQEEFDYALQMKLDLELQNEHSFIFLFDKNQLDLMLARDYVDELYVPVSEWAPDGDFPTVSAADGTAYAADVSGSAMLKELGIQCDGMYAVLRTNTWDDDLNRQAYESSVKILNEIVK